MRSNLKCLFLNLKGEEMRYNTYSNYLKDKYGEKVYKLPINLPITCPNRDGSLGTGGCIFCADIGTGFEAHSNLISVENQLLKNMEIIRPKYKADKFIAYFQNYSNTYMPIDDFIKYTDQACIEGIVGIDVSTRPDCIEREYLDQLKKIRDEKNIDIGIELGLQSININTLNKINRGHGLAEFINAVNIIKEYDFTICVHLIGNLPFDTREDFLEAGKLLSVMGINSVKVHSLYIVKDTLLGEMYKSGQLELITSEEYIDRIIEFIRIISPDMIIQRLLGRAPEEDTLFCNWGMSWRKIQNEIEKRLEEENVIQGEAYKY